MKKLFGSVTGEKAGRYPAYKYRVPKEREGECRHPCLTVWGEWLVHPFREYPQRPPSMNGSFPSIDFHEQVDFAVEIGEERADGSSVVEVFLIPTVDTAATEKRLIFAGRVKTGTTPETCEAIRRIASDVL